MKPLIAVILMSLTLAPAALASVELANVNEPSGCSWYTTGATRWENNMLLMQWVDGCGHEYWSWH